MPNELSAVVDFAGGAVDDLIVTPVQELHSAIAGRVFGSLGPLSRPVRFVHDGISRSVYRAVRAGAK